MRTLVEASPGRRRQQGGQGKGREPGGNIHFYAACGPDFRRHPPLVSVNDCRVAYGARMSRAAISTTEANHETPFKVESIAKASTPEGSAGTWFRYVISQGTNQITGIRSGEQAEVSYLVGEMVERLNERRAGKTRPKTKSS